MRTLEEDVHRIKICALEVINKMNRILNDFFKKNLLLNIKKVILHIGKCME
jgi:hypothetical protein